jgi:hypothetical protein
MSSPVLRGDDPKCLAALAAVKEHGTVSEAARALKMPRQTLDYRFKIGTRWDGADPVAQEASAIVGSEMVPNILWAKTDKHGNTSYSAQYKYGQQDNTAAIMGAIAQGLSEIAPAAHISAPSAPDTLCAVFPVADLHMGLLTDAEEVGTDWDSKKSARVFAETFGRLVSVTPSAGLAVLAQLGDLTHTDDQRNVTPQSGHQLDADTRYFMILRRAVAAMKWAIDALRAKYKKVIYRGCRGNHDITAHYAVTLALSEHYRNVEGVEIIDHAGEFYVHEFGANMLLLHHGDKAKPERLVTFAAAEWPEMWGRSKHRLALSGHVHHETRKEVGGMAFESVGTIIPRDVHAYSHAYSSKRGLVSITLDETQGEISRARVSL